MDADDLRSYRAAIAQVLYRALLGGRAPMPVVGFLHTRSQEAYPGYAAFLKGLEQTGFVEGQSVRIEYRWAAGQ